MISTEAIDLAARLGLGEVVSADPLPPGLGGNELWRLRLVGEQVLLRVFPAGADPSVAEREAVAHRLVAGSSIDVPRVLTHAVIDDRPVLAMEWVTGSPLAEVLLTGDRRPTVDLGQLCGELLLRLHQVPVPTEPVIADRSWVEWAGEYADRLRPMLRDRDHRLLHLDFHPANLIITGDDRLCLLDWANVRVGPPAAELARTLSIMELATIAPNFRDHSPKLIMAFRDGLLAGYEGAGGETAVSAPMMAWAYAVQLHDLADSWVPQDYLDRLRTKINNVLTS